MEEQESRNAQFMSLPELSLSDEAFHDRERAIGILIDPPQARLKEDAFFIEQTDQGFTLHFSMIDVASFIPVNGEFFDQVSTNNLALRWVFFLKKVQQKLLISRFNLVEGEKRPTLTISVPISSSFAAKTPTIKKTYMVADKGLSYGEARDVVKTREDQLTANQIELLIFLGYNLARVMKSGQENFSNAFTKLEKLSDVSDILEKLDDNAIEKVIGQSISIIGSFINTTIGKLFYEQNISAIYRELVTKTFLEQVEVLQTEDQTLLRDQDIFDSFTFFTTIPSGDNPLQLRITEPLSAFMQVINQYILLSFIEQRAHPFSPVRLRSYVYRLNKYKLQYYLSEITKRNRERVGVEE